jgi:WD40 repeat protein
MRSNVPGAAAGSIVLASVVAVMVAPAAGVAEPKAGFQVRLDNSVEIAIPEIGVAAAAVLADNESVVVVGGKDPDPAAESLTAAAAAGAIVNLKTKAVRRFTNGHTTRIEEIAVAADGSRIVSAGSNPKDKIRVWDTKAGKALTPIDPVPGADESELDFKIATFHRSQKVAVTLKDRVRIIDPTGREEPVDLETEYLSGTFPGMLAISPDDKLLACATGSNQVIIWDVGAKKVLYVPSLLPEGENDRDWLMHGLHFLKSGTQLLAARSGKEPDVPKGTPEEKVPAEKRGLFLIDVPKQKITPLGMGAPIYTLHFAVHPSEEWIATVGGAYPDKPVPNLPNLFVGELRVYHYPTRTLAHKVQFEDKGDGEGFYPMWVGFTPDGKKLVAVEGKGKVMAWDFTPVKP